MKQGDIVLVWGATGGLGGYAVQYVLNGGGTPVGVVSSPEKAALLNDLGRRGRHRPPGGELPVLDGRAHPGRVRVAPLRQGHPRPGRRGPRHRVRAPRPPDDGRVGVRLQAGGTIVTCAATSGYMIEYDNRHLWMKLKTIKGSHFANYHEAWDANRLICDGQVLQPLSAVYPLEQVGEAAYQVHHNLHEGKIGVLCLAPTEGLGIDDPEFRAKVGEDQITLFRRHGADVSDLLLDRDRPRRHRRPRPRRRRRLVRRDLRRHRRPSRGRRVRRRRRGAAQGGRLLRPAAHARPRRLDGGQVPGEERRGLHHVGYRVDDCAVALQAVKDAAAG